MKHIYSNDYETYEIRKIVEIGKPIYWIISQDGVWSEGKYKTLKDAKLAIDNQEIFW